MQKEKHFCNAFRLETNSGCTTTIQNVKPNLWSTGTKLPQVQGSTRSVQERSCSQFSGTWREWSTLNFWSRVKLLTLSDMFQHSELSNSESGVFGVIKTQSCNTKMRARTPVAKLRTP
ncbi:hypothetical protein ElyMa_001500000 [Elysia marginata]|uniref:Uncharacterized protein n=1 Tax=Elysia marginata TaxID=1093978 RepID=A0AAV4J6F8_9GAST|nr:hypothetical protein ElyMa_001500000 [Elysia marginata]